MGMFDFFSRKTAVVPKKSGLIGHWKKLEGGSKEDLEGLIAQLEDGDNATVVFTGDRNRASLIMFLLRRKLRPDQESFHMILQGLLSRHPDPENEHTVFTATVHLGGNVRHQREVKERLLDKLHKYVIEFRAVRGE